MTVPTSGPVWRGVAPVSEPDPRQETDLRRETDAERETGPAPIFDPKTGRMEAGARARTPAAAPAGRAGVGAGARTALGWRGRAGAGRWDGSRSSAGTGRRGWAGPLAVVLLLLGVFVTGAGLGSSVGLPWSGWLTSSGREPPRDFPVMEPSRPVRIEIPSIKVAAPVHRVGLAADGSIAVPPLERHNEAGWYDRGPTPGQFGPSIIVGHADTTTGPSVFYHLKQLKRGDQVKVVRVDRSVAVFKIDSVEHFDKSKLPAERVYGDYTRPGLRLITCGGRWLGGSIGYADNIIAFASLVESREP